MSSAARVQSHDTVADSAATFVRVARDYGFAPNPFFGVCTLATCKPRIRSVAQIGDWVVGATLASSQDRCLHLASFATAISLPLSVCDALNAG